MFYTLNGYTMYDYHTLSRRVELHGDGETYSERYVYLFNINSICGSTGEFYVLTSSRSRGALRFIQVILDGANFFCFDR